MSITAEEMFTRLGAEEPAEPAVVKPTATKPAPTESKSLSVEEMFSRMEPEPPGAISRAGTAIAGAAKSVAGAVKEAAPGVIAAVKEAAPAGLEATKDILGRVPGMSPIAPFAAPIVGAAKIGLRGAKRVYNKTEETITSLVESLLLNPKTGQIDPMRTLTEGSTILEKAVAKAAISGGKSMGEAIIKGVAGFAAFMPDDLDPEVYNLMKDPAKLKEMEKTNSVDEIVAIQEKTQAQLDKLSEVAEAITGINLKPENQTEAAVEQLIALAPESMHIAGEEVYEEAADPSQPKWVRRMAAFLGSSTEALGNFLMLSGAKAGKVAGALDSPAGAAMEAQLIKTAARDPVAAQAFVDHIKDANPAAARALQTIVDRAPKMKPGEARNVGERIAKLKQDAIAAKAAEAKAAGFEITGQTPGGKTRIRPARPAEPVGTPESGAVAPVARSAAEMAAALREPGAEPAGFTTVGVTPAGKPRVRATAPPTAPAAKPAIDLSGMGAGMGERLRDQLFEAWGKGESKLSGVRDPILVAAEKQNLPRDATRAEFNIFLRGYEERLAATGKATAKMEPGAAGLADVKARTAADLEATKASGRAILESERELAAREGRLRDRDPPLIETTDATGATVTREALPPDMSARDVSRTIEELVALQELAAQLPKEQLGGSTRSAEELGEAGLTKPGAPDPLAKAGIPGVEILEAEMKSFWAEIVQYFAPETTHKHAELAGASVASEIARQAHIELSNLHQAETNAKFWDKNILEAGEFQRRMHENKPQKTPELDALAAVYRRRNNELAVKDRHLNVKYDVSENFLAHTFQDAKAAREFLINEYGEKKLTDTQWLRDNMFEAYDRAVQHGLKPRLTNPEEIMGAREHMSNIAEMRVRVLDSLEGYGLAKQVTSFDKPPPQWYGAKPWTSPNGKKYWVSKSAYGILHNAFDTVSLWNLDNAFGKTFRAGMYLKNALVPVTLAFSGFHMLHVATIANAVGMKRAYVEWMVNTHGLGSLIAGTPKFAAKFAKEVFYGELVKESAYMGAHALGKALRIKKLQDIEGSGHRLLKVFQGKIPVSKLTAGDKLALKYMLEAGLTPAMPAVYKNGAINKFGQALRQVSSRGIASGATAKAIERLPFAALELTQVPLFEHWIPALKTASFLRDAAQMLKLEPELLNKPAERAVRMRRLAKSADNRFGEMAYDTLFWTRWMKDIGVLCTFSLGWQVGLIREQGGAGFDAVKAFRAQFGKDFGKTAQKGLIDRPAFTVFYTVQSLAYSGLMTWWNTGEQPEGIDFTFPRTGGTNPDGTPERMSTMFFPKEYVALASHVKHEGPIEGLSHIVRNKSSGVVGNVTMALSGVNDMNQEIRDPDAPWFSTDPEKFKDTKSWQTLVALAKDVEPISTKAIRTGQPVARSLVGFSNAPKYITRKDTDLEIRHIYNKYYASKLAPFERAEFSEDRQELTHLKETKDKAGYAAKLKTMKAEYKLKADEVRKLRSGVTNHKDVLLTMFARFTPEQQTEILDNIAERAKDDPEAARELRRFKHKANKKIRHKYKTPAQRGED